MRGGRLLVLAAVFTDKTGDRVCVLTEQCLSRSGVEISSSLPYVIQLDAAPPMILDGLCACVGDTFECANTRIRTCDVLSEYPIRAVHYLTVSHPSFTSPLFCFREQHPLHSLVATTEFNDAVQLEVFGTAR
jgi:hypothetical protein